MADAKDQNSRNWWDFLRVPINIKGVSIPLGVAVLLGLGFLLGSFWPDNPMTKASIRMTVASLPTWTPLSTCTPYPTHTPYPTYTPWATGTPNPTQASLAPTYTPNLPMVLQAHVRVESLRIRLGPSKEEEIVGVVYKDAWITVNARSEDSEWFRIYDVDDLKKVKMYNPTISFRGKWVSIIGLSFAEGEHVQSLPVRYGGIPDGHVMAIRRLNLRIYPSIEDKYVVGVLRYKDTVHPIGQYLEEMNGEVWLWLRIEPPIGYEGYSALWIVAKQGYYVYVDDPYNLIPSLPQVLPGAPPTG